MSESIQLFHPKHTMIMVAPVGAFEFGVGHFTFVLVNASRKRTKVILPFQLESFRNVLRVQMNGVSYTKNPSECPQEPGFQFAWAYYGQDAFQFTVMAAHVTNPLAHPAALNAGRGVDRGTVRFPSPDKFRSAVEQCGQYVRQTSTEFAGRQAHGVITV